MGFATSVRIANTIEVKSLTILTDASGDYTGTVAISGQIKKIALDIGTLTGGAVDVTLTDNVSLETIHTKSNIAASYASYPKIQNKDSSDNAITGQYVEPVVGTAKLVVAQGGNATTGTFYIYYTRI